jgi:hypothetical protein
MITLKNNLKKQLGVNDIQSKVFTRDKDENKENIKSNSNINIIRTPIRRNTIDKSENHKRIRAASN